MSRCVAIGLLILAVAFGQTVAVSADNVSKDWQHELRPFQSKL